MELLKVNLGETIFGGGRVGAQVAWEVRAKGKEGAAILWHCTAYTIEIGKCECSDWICAAAFCLILMEK